MPVAELKKVKPTKKVTPPVSLKVKPTKTGSPQTRISPPLKKPLLAGSSPPTSRSSSGSARTKPDQSDMEGEPQSSRESTDEDMAIHAVLTRGGAANPDLAHLKGQVITLQNLVQKLRAEIKTHQTLSNTYVPASKDGKLALDALAESCDHHMRKNDEQDKQLMNSRGNYQRVNEEYLRLVEKMETMASTKATKLTSDLQEKLEVANKAAQTAIEANQKAQREMEGARTALAEAQAKASGYEVDLTSKQKEIEWLRGMLADESKKSQNILIALTAPK
jgi:chromosome segregation ATPase